MALEVKPRIDLSRYPEPQLTPRVKPRRRPAGPEAVIVSAVRTPIGKFLGAFAEVPATKLGAAAIRAAVERSGIDPALVDEVIMGNVLSAGLGQAPARQAAIGAGLPKDTPCLTINKVCASGLKAIVLAAQAIRAGEAEVVVAGGMENMSRAPYVLDRARTGYRLGHGQLTDLMIADGLWDCYYDFHMGNTAELVAARYGISRQEQDQYALASHQKAVAAMQQGRFQDEIVPVEVPAGKGQTRLVNQDEGPRPDSTLEALARLRPAFDPEGTVTAGNAPGVNDGAAAVVVMSEEKARELGVTPLARILDAFSAGLDPAWVMLTPVPAVRGLLLRNPEWKLEDFELVELNEAFSVQALGVLRELPLDPARVNVNGGAVALGHPIGASGARIVATLLHQMKRQGARRGLATLCLGGGNGVAVAFERVG
jgi:acetyl-CoA C-acetyltransferase